MSHGQYAIKVVRKSDGNGPYYWLDHVRLVVAK